MKKIKNIYFFGLLAFIFSISQLTQCNKEDKPSEKSKEASIISFELGTYKAKLNGTSLSLLIELPYGTDISSLSAKVKLSAKATIKPDPKTVKDYSNPVSFTVTAENGKDSKKYTVMVKILRPVLTFEKLTKEYTKGGHLNATEILNHVKGAKDGYTLKEITNLNPNDIVRVNGTAPNLRLEFNQVGVFTASLHLKHNATSDLDVTLSNAAFEITKGVAPSDLSWRKQIKVYASGGEISNVELLGGVSGPKEGYRVKLVQITSDSGGSGARVSGSGTAAKIVGYGKATILTLTLVLQHATKAEKTLSNAVFEIRKMKAPNNLTWVKQLKTYRSGEEISNVELLSGLEGSKVGYRIKSVAITTDSGGSGARVSGSGRAAKITSYGKPTILTLTLVFEHDTKADKTITGAQFELTRAVSVPLSWSRQSKVYSSPAEISNAELLGGVRGTKDGYRIKSVQITSDSRGSGATVSGSGTAAKIIGYGKATILTLTLVLQHATKAEKTLSSAVFEIRKMPVPVDLSWRKQIKVYSDRGEISNGELLAGLSGTKTGYRVKTLTISDARGTGARVSGNGTAAKIVGYTKVGTLTLSIVFEHDTKEDKNITGAEFEITKGSAESLTWRKQTKAFSSSGEITNADLLAGVTGSGKNGYTIKTVMISNDGGTSAVVSGSGRAAKITSYTKAGTLTLTLVLAHDTKEDATIRNAEFEITLLSWTKQTKQFSNGGEITNANLLTGVTGSSKNGYTIKTVTITSTNGTGARISGSGTSAKITSYTKAGTLTLTLVLQHTSKPDVILRNAQFEITKGSAESLTWKKQTKPFSSSGEITNVELLTGVTGSGKNGYTIKTVNITNNGGMTSARVVGSGRAAKITNYTKAGTFTLTIVLEHHTKEDATIRNAEFEITKANAESLSWTKQTKQFSSGGEITNAELLGGVTGSGKTGYTIKTVTITNKNGTSARVSGSGTSAKITSYNKIGTLTLTIVLQHDTKDDVTLRNAEFHIYRDIFTISSSGVVTLKTSVDRNSLTTVTIPYMIKGITVTIIGNNTFKDFRNLTHITIPNSVTIIGNNTFRNCVSLTSITIPNLVTSIEFEAFYNCDKLTSITIPNSVTSIADGAFFGCTSLTSITIPNSVTSIGRRAFHFCSSLISITIPDSVTSIEGNAFTLCTSLTSITMGNSVTSIETGAFYGCSKLTSITIPDSVTSIGKWTFRDCTSLMTSH